MLFSLYSCVLVSCYFTSLVCFSLVTHPVGYCFLLVLNALFVSLSVALKAGFSWYLALFGLVYVGGVYILFIFVSVHSPNVVYRPGFGLKWSPMFFFFFFFLLNLFFLPSNAWQDNSWYLCSGLEGQSYCLLGLVVLLGFVLVGYIVGCKRSFYR